MFANFFYLGGEAEYNGATPGGAHDLFLLLCLRTMHGMRLNKHSLCVHALPQDYLSVPKFDVHKVTSEVVRFLILCLVFLGLDIAPTLPFFSIQPALIWVMTA